VKKKFVTLMAALLITTCCTSIAMAGEWKKDYHGWWYQNDDGSYITNSWYQDTDGKWYYFGSDGYMLENQWIDGKYYVDKNGEMLVDTVTPDGKHVNSRGELVIGTGLYEGYENCKEFERDDVTFKVYYNNIYTGQNTGISYAITDITVSKAGDIRAVGTKVAEGTDKNLSLATTIIIDNDKNRTKWKFNDKIVFHKDMNIDSPKIMKIGMYEARPDWTVRIYIAAPKG